MSTKISELPVAQEIIWLNESDVADTGFARRGAGIVGVTKGGADDDGLLQFQISGGHKFRLGAFASGWGLTLTDDGAGIVTFGGSNHSILVKYDSADGLIGWSASVAAKGDVAIGRAAASLLKVTDGTTGGAGIEFTEMTAPSAGASNTARLFCRDNGSGKSQLCVIFATGAVQVIATEP